MSVDRQTTHDSNVGGGGRLGALGAALTHHRGSRLRLMVGPHRTTDPGHEKVLPAIVPSLNIDRASWAYTAPIALIAVRFHVAAIPGARGKVVIPPPTAGTDVCRYPCAAFCPQQNSGTWHHMCVCV